MSRRRYVPFWDEGGLVAKIRSGPAAAYRATGRADAPGVPSANGRTSVAWR